MWQTENQGIDLVYVYRILIRAYIREMEIVMNPPTNFSRIIDRKKYDVSTATLLAADDFWDGHNFERHGRNQFLYRTPKGNYFIVRRTMWQGEQDTLEPIDQESAIEAFETYLNEHRVSYSEAFPDVTVTEA